MNDAIRTAQWLLSDAAGGRVVLRQVSPDRYELDGSPETVRRAWEYIRPVLTGDLDGPTIQFLAAFAESFRD